MSQLFEITFVASNTMVEFNKTRKLIGDNYNMKSQKLLLVLEEQEVMETYTAWKQKNIVTCIMLLSNMNDYVMCEFEQSEKFHLMWVVLKAKFNRLVQEGADHS